MERDDRPTESGVTQKTPGEGGSQNGERSSLARWIELFKALILKVPRLDGRLFGRTRKAFARVLSAREGIGPMDDIKGAFGHIPLRKKGLGYLLAAFVLTVYLLSGVYTVRPGEEAVATIFGKQVRGNITEGLHYRLPWPFEAIEKVNAMEIRRIDVGVRTADRPRLFPKKSLASTASAAAGHGGHAGHGTDTRAVSNPTRSNPGSSKNQFLTGDENILEIRMNIQYRIKDASDYLFNVGSPDSLVPYATRAAVTEILGGMRVDNLLTVAKSQIQKRITRVAQRMLDRYATGLHIVHVNLQEVNPPREVAQAFRDVASAKEEREEKINKAQGYWNTVIPEARGKAHRLISQAEGYKEETINRARGEAGKFSVMLTEYREAKAVTEYRLYLETMEKILARTKKFVVDSKKERVNLKFVK
jgi:membrane protease subunit HflK